MTRQLGLVIATTVFLTAFLAAQDPPAKDKQADKQPAAKKQPAAGEWVLFSSSEGKCEILFPAMPSLTPVDGGKQAQLFTQMGKAGFLLGFSALPKEIPAGNAEIVDKVLAGVGQELVKKMKGAKITKETPTKVLDLPARDIDITLAGTNGRFTIVAAPRMAYWMVVFGPGESADSADAKKFRGSFKINPDAKDTEVAKADPKENPAAKAAQDLQEIVERLHKEFEDAGAQLEKPDPGDKTQGVQQAIIDDLQKLIDQQDKSNSAQAGGDPMPMPGGEKGDPKPMPGGEKGDPKPMPGGEKGDPKPMPGGEKGDPKPMPGGEKGDPKPMPGGEKGDPKPMPGGEKGDPKQGKDKGLDKLGKKEGKGDPKEGKGGNEPGKGGDSPPGKFLTEKEKEGLWGGLPKREREKLNALAGDRMIPRYEELLRQYYRTIAEQGRKKEGE